MIKLLNLVGEGSESIGWTVNIDNTDQQDPKSYVTLSGVESKVSILLNQDDYMELTHVQGVNTRAATKLSVINSDVDQSYKPVIKLAEPDDDTTIILLNFETEVGESIITVWVDNCIIIDYEIEEKEMRSRLALSAVGINRLNHTDIIIRYGRIGGRSLTTRTVRYAAASTPTLKVDLFKETEKVESIGEPSVIDIKTLDLSSISID